VSKLPITQEGEIQLLTAALTLRQTIQAGQRIRSLVS